MVLKRVIVLLLPILVLQISCAKIQKIQSKTLHVNPLELIDDASKLLDDLSQTVLGNILTAHDQLDDLRFDVTSHSINVRYSTEEDIQQQYQTLLQEVANLKDVAGIADKDISSCLNGNEEKIDGQPETYRGQCNDCIATTESDSDTTITDSRYNIDIVINKVQSLNFGLGRCADDACVSDIIDQANQLADDLPLEIKVDVQKASDALEIVKVKIQDCSDTTLADYVQVSSKLIDTMTDCVNTIL